ncbi:MULTISPECIES: hydroxyacylglutathione hydrolase [unclassified Jeotgalibaca]|uniref:hydroxyacylglutathione hydrolase n=1 Tax=unclassified Jeotgalibaca TaxID=2621505 RepID=UPI003FCFEA22
MEVSLIKAFSDNYIWVIEEGEDIAVVDPGEANGVLSYLEENKSNLVAILLTHNHDDHIGGVREILEKYPDVPVYGPTETDSLATQIVQEGDTFELFGETVEVFKTAGHTEEHISFLMGDILFCGDALFSGGCGRVFTGDYEAQYEALQKFKGLNDNVKVYAGHEYTQTNLRFAMSETPSNPDILTALHEVNDKRAIEMPTLPSTIGKEKLINLFLNADTLEDFIELRKARDNF